MRRGHPVWGSTRLFLLTRGAGALALDHLFGWESGRPGRVYCSTSSAASVMISTPRGRASSSVSNPGRCQLSVMPLSGFAVTQKHQAAQRRSHEEAQVIREAIAPVLDDVGLTNHPLGRSLDGTGHMVVVDQGRERVVDLGAERPPGGADDRPGHVLDPVKQAGAQGVVVQGQVDLDGRVTGLAAAALLRP